MAANNPPKVKRRGLKEIMDNPECINETTDIPAVLFRDIILSHRPETEIICRKIDEYYLQKTGSIDKARTERHNLLKALYSDKVPFDRLMTFIQATGCDSYEVSIKITFGEFTHEHRVSVRNRFAKNKHSRRTKKE